MEKNLKIVPKRERDLFGCFREFEWS